MVSFYILRHCGLHNGLTSFADIKAKTRWAIEGDENSEFFHGIVNNKFLRSRFKGLFIEGCNSSFIALVPKVQDLLHVSDFRPISLIGCQYKVIAKILANRLLQVVNSIIGEVQSAYIKGRQIIYGPLMVNEIINWASKKNKRLFLFKVDFEKAFDSLDWRFLDHVTDQMGFSLKWRNWIKGCLNSVYGLMIVNGSPTKEFKINKGLRQGVNIGSGNVNISHLQFADDALIIGKYIDKAIVVPFGNKIRWDNSIPIKINIHNWRLLDDRLPTRMNLDIHDMDLNSIRCPVCDDALETAQHIFIDCMIARNLWVMIVDYPKDLQSLIFWSDSASLPDRLNSCFDAIIQSTTWIIWRYPNRLCFDIHHSRKDNLGDEIKTVLLLD
nr:cysteine-rich receptor-like protein kinase [Tanacetum cinerariifolium]